VDSLVSSLTVNAPTQQPGGGGSPGDGGSPAAGDGGSPAAGGGDGNNP